MSPGGIGTSSSRDVWVRVIGFPTEGIRHALPPETAYDLQFDPMEHLAGSKTPDVATIMVGYKRATILSGAQRSIPSSHQDRRKN
jgi:hypothetical protein